jgi:hypothetical protein
MNTWIRLVILLFFVFSSVAGFMIKLPSSFRHFDKELHGIFYFSAAAFLNVLFLTKNAPKHFIIFIILLLFGICIEYAQEYSNIYFHSKIHGRFDGEDIQANFIGLISFTFIWLLFYFFQKVKY